MRRYVRWGGWTVAACGAVLLSSCSDPERAALKIFSDQGLTVLRPARDYVAPGGLVIWPSGGRAEYVDPLDAAAVADTNAFTSVIYEAQDKQAAKFSLVLGLIEKMMPVAIGVSATSTGEVKLTQIDAPGKRITFPNVTSLIRAPNTEAFVFEQVKAGARAFVIQEVYASNSLTLSSSSGGSLGASLRGEKISECGSAAPSEADKDKKEASPAPTSVTGEGGGTPSATPVANPVKPASMSGAAAMTPAANPVKPVSTSTVGTAASTPGRGLASGSSSSSGASSGAGISSDPSATPATDPTKTLRPSGAVGVCMEGAYSLKFTSKERLPFAVRLMEVVRVPGSPGKALKVKLGSFKFPGSLGDSDVEKATFVDPAKPVLESLVRRTAKIPGAGK